MFNVYKNQPSRQTGSRNLTDPKTLPTIWHTYMKLVTKYQIPVINSCLEKCDEKWAYMFNVYKNQQSRQTGSRNLMGPKTLPTIWGTYMKLVTKYQISAINSCWEKCDEKWAYMFNVYKNQQSRQTGSRNMMGPKMLPTIWGTYMKLVTKYQISAINSYWEKCDEKYLGRTEGRTEVKQYTPSPFGERGYKNINLFNLHNKGIGHSDVILILDMPLCSSTFTYKRWRHCDCHFFNLWPLQPMFSFGHYFVLDWIFIWKEYLTAFTMGIIHQISFGRRRCCFISG
jgi:hypothetical protein